MTMQAAPKTSAAQLEFAGKPYLLLESIDQVASGLPTGIRRSWSYEQVAVQNADVQREFEIALRSFARGGGFAFAREAGTYDDADGWVASADGAISTWTYRTDAEPATFYDGDLNIAGAIRGFLHEFGDSVYMFHGRYVVKYPVPSGYVGWDWVAYHGERTDLGFNEAAGNGIVANRPVRYRSKVYVPIKVRTSDAPNEFVVLDTQNTKIEEIQTIAISGTPTTGLFDMTYGPTTVFGLAWNISTVDLEAAIQSIPGLQSATITNRAGVAPNYTYTVDLSQVGGQAYAPGPGVASPFEFTFVDTFDAGGVAGATTQAGTTDLWEPGPVGVTAIAFATIDHPISGPVLVKASGNEISINAGDPMTAGDWGPGYEVGDDGIDIASLSVYGTDLLVWKEDGTLWIFDSQAIAHLVTDVRGVGGVLEGANATTHFGHQYIPTGAGLWEWRPGAARIVGPEQDQAYLHASSQSWGHVMGMAAYGDSLYMVVSANDGTGDGKLWQFTQAARSQQMPLTPHPIFTLPTPQDVIVVDRKPGLAPDLGLTCTDFATGSGGNLTWSNPEAASTVRPDTILEGVDTLYAEAEAINPGGSDVTHWLRGLFPSDVALPPSVTVTGLELIVDARKVSDERVELVGTGRHATIQATGTLRLEPPSGVAAGDILVAVVTTENVGAASAPSGWTTVFWGGNYTSTFWRVTDLADSYDVPVVGGATGFILALRNCDPAPFTPAFPFFSDDEFHGQLEGIVSFPDAETEYALIIHSFEGPEGVFIGPTQREWQAIGNNSFEADGERKEVVVYGVPVDPYEGTTMFSGINPRRVPEPSGAPYTANQMVIIRVKGPNSSNPLATMDAICAIRNGVRQADQSVAWYLHQNDLQVDATLKIDWTKQVFGSSNDLWGTSWTGSINADDGFVISYAVTRGKVQVRSMRARIYYEGSGGTAESMLVMMVMDDSQNAEATLRVASLPRYGMQVGGDPLVERAHPGAAFRTSRYDNPGREVLKNYRAVEFFAQIDKLAFGDALWLEASVDDGVPFALLQDPESEVGLVGLASTTGSYRFYFPRGSTGRHVRIVVHGGDLGTSAKVRDIVIRGAYRVETTQQHTFVVKLREDNQFARGSETRSITEQITDLEDLLEAEGDIAFRRPDGRRGSCEVLHVQAQEVEFKRDQPSQWVAIVVARESPHA